MKTKRLDYAVPRQAALARLILAQRDFQSALRAVELVLERVKSQNDPLFEPLEHAAVICYARPFCGGRSFKRIPGRYDVFDDPARKQMHDYLITHRHEIVAHTNQQVHIVSMVPAGGRVSWNAGRNLGIIAFGEHIESRVLKLSVFPRFKSLCEFQRERIRAHVDEERAAIFPPTRQAPNAT